MGSIFYWLCFSPLVYKQVIEDRLRQIVVGDPWLIHYQTILDHASMSLLIRLEHVMSSVHLRPFQDSSATAAAAFFLVLFFLLR